VVDLKFGEDSGLELIEDLPAVGPEIMMVRLTGHASIATAGNLGMYRRTLQRKLAKKPAAG
jgi:ActR/RegA family two-component response regulator